MKNFDWLSFFAGLAAGSVAMTLYAKYQATAAAASPQSTYSFTAPSVPNLLGPTSPTTTT